MKASVIHQPFPDTRSAIDEANITFLDIKETFVTIFDHLQKAEASNLHHEYNLAQKQLRTLSDQLKLLNKRINAAKR